MTMNHKEIPLLGMTRKRTDLNRNITVIEETFSPLEDQRILDIGCGRGNLLKALANRLAKPTGIDVNMQSLIEARRKCPRAELIHTGAGDLA
ncbi:MAG: class I SAM-dependent methyltransferase, partial [Rhodobacteraceae bacterium]|nr:class I SAM-dependent methyltransferase [Paracoccaceae bacterium]